MADFINSYKKAQNEEAKDALMEEAVVHILNDQKRSEWSNLLAENYDVHRQRPGKKPFALSWIKWMSVAASIALLVFSLYTFIFRMDDPTKLANQFLSSSFVEHPGLAQDLGQQDEARRILAIEA